ncbi:class I adenylate-forming enzyme family protein [Streptomyces sp. NPDC021080]|uniref:class I adenylate-forming enzyme family protein n=1 Tax=Streptomyces sp. NPDC021080 TaxID=3365110 RepID=UPI0037A62C30
MSSDPSAVALVHGERRLTHGEALQEVHRAARALAGQGLGRGDTVLFLLGNTPEAVLYPISAQLIGCCVLFLRPTIGDEVNAAAVRTLAPAVLVVDPCNEETARGVLEHVEVPRVLTLGPAGLGQDLLPLVARQSAAPVEPVADEHDRALILRTSGTTGMPKAAGHTFANIAEFLRMESCLRHPGPRRFLHYGLMDSVSGQNTMWNLAAGGTTVLLDGADSEEVLAAVERERITHLLAHPGTLARLTAACSGGGAVFRELRQIEYGSAPAAARLLREALEVFGPRLLGVYGSYEGGYLTSLGCDEHQEELLGSVGTPLPGIRVEVREPGGRRVEAGSAGEVWVHTPAAMTGYVQNPEATARVLRDGWLHTGDRGRLDEAGRLHLMGRVDDVIFVDGHNVHAHEVERTLAEHPDVTWAAVLGVSDAVRGEAVHAAVVTAPGSQVDAEGLRMHVQARLGVHHAPAGVQLVPRALLTPRGKTDREALRALVTPSALPVREPAEGVPTDGACDGEAPGAVGVGGV